MSRKVALGVVWFRRDLRLHDNAALHHALRACDSVIPFFVFDTDILERLRKNDRRVDFIHRSVTEMHETLVKEHRSGMVVRHGRAVEELLKCVKTTGATAVFVNRDYEPDAVTRDESAKAALATVGASYQSFKDHVICEAGEVVKADGTPIQIFKFYQAAWMKKVQPESDFSPMACTPGMDGRGSFATRNAKEAKIPSLQDIGFSSTDLDDTGAKAGALSGRAQLAAFTPKLSQYQLLRDFPAANATSKLSVHLRFGTISTREAFAAAKSAHGEGASKWMSELVWREYYQQKLVKAEAPSSWAVPSATASSSELDQFVAKYGKKKVELFLKWSSGETGYPIVDAAIQELHQTGYMHNRMRMLTAGFLVKHLRLDWRWGERFFAEKLLDYDLGQNIGGWMWAASIGPDAQPPFQVFNPMTQSKKFDNDGEYIRRFLGDKVKHMTNTELHEPGSSKTYPSPIVCHVKARAEWLESIKKPSVKRSRSRSPPPS